MNAQSNGARLALRVLMVIAAVIVVMVVFFSTSASENSSLRRWVPFVDAPMCERVSEWSERAEDHAQLWMSTFEYEIQGINPDFNDILSDIDLAVDWLESNPPPGSDADADAVYDEYLVGLYNTREYFQSALDTGVVVDDAFVADVEALAAQFRWGAISGC